MILRSSWDGARREVREPLREGAGGLWAGLGLLHVTLPACSESPELPGHRVLGPSTLVHRSSSAVCVVPSPPPTTTTYPDLLFWTHLGGVQHVTVSSGLTPSLGLLGQAKSAECADSQAAPEWPAPLLHRKPSLVKFPKSVMLKPSSVDQ